ncbi:MAG TPA: hypothetical protein VM934_08660 [Pyrinomonadaceae bacterium]|jgi:hypothetical protein|nr:hypothetical protein [Pyrinomonadaceae bacterium]
MSKEPQTVPDIFRRAQAIMRERPDMTLKDLRAVLLKEYNGAPMPPVHILTIPEQDSRAPEEDWSAGLSIVLRGIQTENWREIINGIALSLQNTDRYERERGHTGTADEWHDRSVGIGGAIEKGVGKWMPEELMKLAERSTKKR